MLLRAVRALILLCGLSAWQAAIALSQSSAKVPHSPSSPASQSSGSIVSPALEKELIAALKKNSKEEDAKSLWANPNSATSIALALVAILSLSFTVYQFARNRKDSDVWKLRDLLASRRLKLVEILPWLESGESHRSAAIAIIDGHLEDHPELCQTWASAVGACCVGIIAKHDTSLSPLDERDLNRMFSILVRMRSMQRKDAVATHAETIATILRAVEELPARMVLGPSGEQITPARRQAFIHAVQHMLQQHPQLVVDE
jgi:hypothetical protein